MTRRQDLRRVPWRLLALFGVAACSGRARGPEPGPTPTAAGAARDAAASAPARIERTLCTQAAAHEIATFADANLEHIVRAALDIGADDPLTCDQLAHVRSLYAPDARIRDLDGIQGLRNLEVLYVYGNNSVRDLTPLVGLDALWDLSLARNAIEDLGPLAELPALTSLDLLGNPIGDLAPLAGLAGLTRLRIGESPGISDLGPLVGLGALTRLELDGNAIVDVAPLAAISSLTRLSLQGNRQLVDVGPLRELQRLEILLLGGTSVTDLAPLAALPSLHTLGLDGTGVSDLGPLLGLRTLARLDLRGNRTLMDIQPLLFNAGLGPGDAVRLERTSVSCRDVAALQGQGVTVLTDCR